MSTAEIVAPSRVMPTTRTTLTVWIRRDSSLIPLSWTGCQYDFREQALGRSLMYSDAGHEFWPDEIEWVDWS
jgi:hypothetical protein